MFCFLNIICYVYVSVFVYFYDSKMTFNLIRSYMNNIYIYINMGNRKHTITAFSSVSEGSTHFWGLLFSDLLFSRHDF